MTTAPSPAMPDIPAPITDPDGPETSPVTDPLPEDPPTPDEPPVPAPEPQTSPEES